MEEAIAVLGDCHWCDGSPIREKFVQILSQCEPQQQKQLIGEQLYRQIYTWYPELAGKITGMLLKMDNFELLHMLEDPESLKATVEEAVVVLGDYYWCAHDGSPTSDKFMQIFTQCEPQQQKQLIGEQLYRQIYTLYPGLAGKLTGMLLEMENFELFHMLEDSESLQAKVEEAVAVLNDHPSLA